MYLTVLNYNNGKVYQYKEDFVKINCEEFLVNEGFDLEQIEFMCHEDNTLYI